MAVPSTSAQLFKEVQHLSVVGDKHHLVTSCTSRHCQDVVKNKHFTWNKSTNFLLRNRETHSHQTWMNYSRNKLLVAHSHQAVCCCSRGDLTLNQPNWKPLIISTELQDTAESQWATPSHSCSHVIYSYIDPRRHLGRKSAEGGSVADRVHCLIDYETCCLCMYLEREREEEPVCCDITNTTVS